MLTIGILKNDKTFGLKNVKEESWQIFCKTVIFSIFAKFATIWQPGATARIFDW